MTESIEQFAGWHQPVEKTPITEEQASQLPSLEKVVYHNGRFEDLVGSTAIAEQNGQEGKVMTSPRSLLHFVRETAEKNGVLPWDVTQAIRAIGISNPSELAEITKKYKETITYISDIHGGDEKLYQKLNEIAQNPPEYAIFGGDIIGTKNFEDLQRLFYNWLNNHSKNELLKTNPNASDDEILSYTGTKPPTEDFTLRDGFLKLRTFELELAGKTPDEIAEQLRQLSNHDMAEEIRRYAKYVHYGHYASNLPDEAKQELARGLEENAQKVLSPIKKMQEQGTKIAILEGNWDARAPIDFVPGEPTAIPLPQELRLFNPKTFFENNGVPFHDTLDTLETDTTLQLLLPFDAIVNFSSLDEQRLTDIKNRIVQARASHKSIVAVAHGEPNWEIHNLTNPASKASGEHAQVVGGLKEAIKQFAPDEIIYGHLHDPITNEHGAPIAPDTKYALKLQGDSVDLVKSPSEFDSQSTVASHIRFRTTNNLEVSRKNKERKIEGFGGKRSALKSNI